MPDVGWAFCVAKGTRIPALKCGLVYAWPAGCSLPLPSLPTSGPLMVLSLDRSPLSSLGQLQKGSVQRAPLQPVTCPSYLSLHCQLMYSNRQVGDRAGRRRIDAEM